MWLYRKIIGNNWEFICVNSSIFSLFGRESPLIVIKYIKCISLYNVLYTVSTQQYVSTVILYVGYSESKYRLRISRAHPRDCHVAHVQ